MNDSIFSLREEKAAYAKEAELTAKRLNYYEKEILGEISKFTQSLIQF